MFKKLLCVISLLYSALFHSSAEVDYLKLKTGGTGDAFLIPRGDSSKEFKLAETENFDSSNDKVIYYDNDGKIVIYLPTAKDSDYDRVKEAKKQFENILNSELINNDDFNVEYVDVPTTMESGLMLGIAVRVDNAIKKDGGKNIETFPVMCAKKKQNKFHGFFADKDGWKRSLGILDDRDDRYRYNFCGKKGGTTTLYPGYIAVGYGFYLSDIEHTERQLFYSMLHNNAILKNSTRIALIGRESNDKFRDILDVNDRFASNDDEPIVPEFDSNRYRNSTFFVWTKGNPCISCRGWVDNGGICCTEWYKCVIYPALTNENSKIHGSKVFLYFNDYGLNDATQSVIDAVWAHTGIAHSDKPKKLILSSRVTGDTTDDLAQLVKCYKVKKTVNSGEQKTCNAENPMKLKEVDNFEVWSVKTVSDRGETETVEYSFTENSKDKLQQQTSLSSQHIPNLIVGKNAYIITKYDRAAIINKLNRWTNGNARGDDLKIEYINHYN